jgi:tetratricopeptide (TPR) repeat protein
MNLRSRIQTLLKEIEVYSAHALYADARRKCAELAELIDGCGNIKNKDTLLGAISKKRRNIEAAARNFEGNGKAKKMSEKEMDLVKSLVSVSEEDGNDAANWEVARACLVMGQFDKALDEFNRLIDNRYQLLSTAKNVMRCYIGLSCMDDAVEKYNEWFNAGIFSAEELENIRTYLQENLKKRNIDRTLPIPDAAGDGPQGAASEEFIDILSVKFAANGKSNKQVQAALDVHSQKGTTISVIVPGSSKELLEILQDGRRIKNVELHSSSIVFTDHCLVSDKREIESGPKKGDYTVSMKILDAD